MIEIKVNSEVRDVTAELFLGLNAWQLLWCTLGVIAGGGAGIISFLLFELSTTYISYIAVVVVIPFAAMGFYRWHQMTAFEVLKLIITRWCDPKVKTYQGENEEYIQYLMNKKKRESKHKKIMINLRKIRRKKGAEDGDKNTY